MMWFTLLSLVALLASAQEDTSVPAFPSNTSSYALSSNATQQLVLGLPVTPSANDPPIYALTDAAAALPPRDANTVSGVGDHLWNTNPATSTNISMPSRAIAYINCDSDVYNRGNLGLAQVVDNSIAANVSSILFYSVEQDFCLLNGTLTQSQSAYNLFYSMTTASDSIAVLNSINAMVGGAAMIMTQAAYNNVMSAGQGSSGIENTPSTAVAMIILYSITGVITALFLAIIVTGAVRAHRHPERYGPHNVLGRPRQSRAKGLARAMLDTLPIVKFGEKQAPKPSDVELGESSVAGATRESNAQSGSQDEGAAHTQQVEMSKQTGTPEAAISTDTGTAANTTNNDQSQNAEHVACSICTEDFEQGQDIRVLPCDHKFHPACVDPWLLDVSGTCPLCRVDLRPQEERRSADGNEHDAERNSREGEPLPPPLGQNRNRRRDTILNFLDRRRMQDSSQEERISALRRWRQATRRSRAPPAETDGEPHRDGGNDTQGPR